MSSEGRWGDVQTSEFADESVGVGRVARLVLPAFAVATLFGLGFAFRVALLVPDCFDEVRDVILPPEALLPFALAIAFQGFEPVEGTPGRERIRRRDVFVIGRQPVSGEAESLHPHHLAEVG
jgi:hypothetical protein